MPVITKVMAASELSRIAYDEKENIKDRLAAAKALKRSVAALIAKLESS